MTRQTTSTLLARLVAFLPYALPVLGGVLGVSDINTTSSGNPVLGIALGALAGWAVSSVLMKFINRRL